MSTRHRVLLILSALLTSVLVDHAAAQNGPVYAPHSNQVNSPIWYGPSCSSCSPISVAPIYAPSPIYGPSACNGCPIQSTMAPMAVDAIYPQTMGIVDYPTIPHVYQTPVVTPQFESYPTPPVAPQPPETDDSDTIVSPSDVSIQELERQAQVERVITIEGFVERLDAKVDEVATDVETLNEKVDALEAHVKASGQETMDWAKQTQDELKTYLNRQKKQTASVSARVDEVIQSHQANDERVAKLNQRLQTQAEQIASLTKTIADLQKAQNNAAGQTDNQEALLRLQADLKKAIARLQSGSKQPSDKNAQAQLDERLTAIGKLVEREVQRSIREEKDRIVRSIIRQATREIKDEAQNQSKPKPSEPRKPAEPRKRIKRDRDQS